MTTMDMVAASAGGLAFGWLSIRANMLKSRFDSWCSVPTLAELSLLVLAVIRRIVARSIVRTGVHTTLRETLLLVGLSVTSLVKMINLHLHLHLHLQAPGATATSTNERRGNPCGPGQSAGTLSRDGKLISRGYSGKHRGKNNPALDVVGGGQIPADRWKIGAPYDSDLGAPTR